MTRIMYGISGEGNGHVTRSWAVIDKLSKGHDIVAITDGRAYEYLKKKHKSTIKAKGLHLAYKNNKVAAWGTFWVNIKNIPWLFQAIKIIRKTIKEQRPQIIINDFSALTNLMGLLYRIPILTVGNNQLVLKAKLDLPKGWWWSKLKAKMAIRLMVQTADQRLITSFFFPPLKGTRSRFIPPILRNEIRKLIPANKGKILVYQTSPSNQELVKVLNKIDDSFVAYGFGRTGKMGNVQLKKFSDKEFLKDLKEARAVIMNGGFSLMTECLYLKKPICSIPIKDQIEQMVNAWYLDKKGWGKLVQENDERQIRDFLKNLNKYQKNQRSCRFDYDLPFKMIEQEIKHLTK